MRLLQLTALALGTVLSANELAAQITTRTPPAGAPTPRAPIPGAPAPRTPTPRTPAPRTPPAAAGARPAQPAGTAAITTGFLQGVALDSIHGGPLIEAVVQLEGTDRIGITDSLGRFLVDSVKPGSYRVLIDHPVLDTLGIALATNPMPIGANEVTRLVVAVPSGEFLAAKFCTPARRNLGPGVLVGRVREPDSEVAAVGARVSIVWYDPEPTGLPQGVAAKMKKVPRVRETTVAEDGTYRLCGLPQQFEGKLQAQRKDGGTTAEVAVSQSENVLTLRSMSVAPRTVAAAGPEGVMTATQKGAARVSGRVINNAGAPVANARVGLTGHAAATVTRASGEFTLDSLPAGTQSLIVRQLGYAPTEVPVELSGRTPLRGVVVKMGNYVPELAPMEVVSARDAGLERVGFTGRKRLSAGGYFLTPEQIESRRASRFTDLLTTIPSIRVSGSMGQMVVTPTRGSGSSCVSLVVDGSKWDQLQPGDIDSFLQATEASAIEVYASGTVPIEFTSVGRDCTVIVVWTKTRVLRNNRKR